MILLTGAITDRNKEAVFANTVLVWVEPTANMDLPMVNQFCNDLYGIEGEELVIWTNSPDLINRINFTHIWRVEDGKLEKKFREGIPTSQEMASCPLSELVARNWIFP